jgi:hypothetical protein
MSRRFVVEGDGFPVTRAIRSGLKVENGSAVYCVARIPLGSHGDLSLAVSVQITGRDAYVVTFGKRTADLMLGPGWVLIPNHLVLVDQDDVGFPIAIHVGQLQSVSDAYFDVDVLLSKLGFLCFERKS